MKNAEAIYHAAKADNLPSSLLDLYHLTGTVAARYPDASWQNNLPVDAITDDYQLISFLAYRSESEQPAIVADIIVSMWQDDPFTYITWYPHA